MTFHVLDGRFPAAPGWGLELRAGRADRDRMSRHRTLIITVAAAVAAAAATGAGAWLVMSPSSPIASDSINGCASAITQQWTRNVAGDASPAEVDRQGQDFFPACDGLSEADYRKALAGVVGVTPDQLPEP
jgi:hypothetical protein